MRLVGAGDLPRLLSEDIAQGEARDRVEHDRDDHFIRTGARLEETCDARVEGARDDCGEQCEDRVQDRGQVEAEADPHGRESPEDDLALSADVEQSRPEAEAQAKAADDQRDRVEEGVRNRLDLTLEA